MEITYEHSLKNRHTSQSTDSTVFSCVAAFVKAFIKYRAHSSFLLYLSTDVRPTVFNFDLMLNVAFVKATQLEATPYGKQAIQYFKWIQTETLYKQLTEFPPNPDGTITGNNSNRT